MGSMNPGDTLQDATEEVHICANSRKVSPMRRFASDSGQLAKLDEILRQLKNGGHCLLLYFQIIRLIDLMEEYLTYRSYKLV